MSIEIDIYLPIGVGVLTGIIFSILFVKYGKSKSYNITLFGMNSNSIVTGSALFLIVASLTILGGLSAIVRDTEFIVKDPIKFTIETILMGIVPALAILLVIYYRTNKISTTNISEFFLLAGKFALFHILFQLSGYYRYVFG